MEVASGFRYLACFLLLGLVPSCLAQEARIRVINGTNGRPLPNFAASISFLYDKNYDKEIPANYNASLRLETDGNGQAYFKIPQPPPMHFAAQVTVDWSHWDCGGCAILASTDDLAKKGIVMPVATKDANKFALYKAAPGEILVIVRPLSFFERFLYQLMKE
jgi:hypothetical protein